ncbi:MAG: hypothetical protein OEM24_12745 [Paracoccaceae bacterium]|nr:hypothetical protein [Paracoccaceae bacterium]
MRWIVLVATCLAGPALAQDLLFFRSPSGNINCMIATEDWAEARCDLMELTMSFRKPPPDCDLDWGHAFSVGHSGPGTPACVGDSVRDPGSLVLDYGKSVSLAGFTCSSEPSGMTCTNREGHGFTVAREAQGVF